MAALPRNYQQTPGKICACPGRRGRRPHRWAKYITHFFVSIPASSRRGREPPYRWARYPSRRDRGIVLYKHHTAHHIFFMCNIARFLWRVQAPARGLFPATIPNFSFLIPNSAATPHSYLLPPNFHSCSAQSRLRPTALCQPASSFSRSGASMLGVKVMLQCHRLRISSRSFHTQVARPAR